LCETQAAINKTLDALDMIAKNVAAQPGSHSTWRFTTL